MDLSDLAKLSADQDAGHRFELIDPVHGEPTGIAFVIVGPDSKTNREARFDLDRELARLAAKKNGSTPETREEAVTDFLFAVTRSWEVTDGGNALPFTRENFGRLLSAATWVRGQVDIFAGDRKPYFPDPKKKA